MTTVNRFVHLSPRNLLKITLDLGLLGSAYLLAYLIRFDFQLTSFNYQKIFQTLPLALLVGFIALITFRVYQSRWEYASVKDLISIFFAVTAGWSLFILLLYFLRLHTVPRSVMLIYWILSILFLGGIRFSRRIQHEFISSSSVNKKRVLIIGAGDAGEMIIRQMKNSPDMELFPAALLDDDPHKLYTKIHGVPVLGSVDDIQKVIRQKKIDEIIIATPSATPAQMRRIVRSCEQTGKEFKTVPGPRELVNGNVHLSQVRKVRIEDLLDRDPVEINIEEIQSLVKDKVILVTGAGGSIGSELSRQILTMNPQKLICLDRVENSLFYLEKELVAISKSKNYEIIISDILEYEKNDKIFRKFRPHIVFHAAAYKHVPLMELHPEEAVKNNVFGTKNMIMLSEKHGVEKFILISTDKAVAPTSVMGATKRLAELIVQSYSRETSLKMITVRFGNVLASYGSVVPLFQKQIARGGPITVTHPEMKRFFMTIPEAVKLILEGARMGESSEIFVLDMGEPIKIIDFARHFISLSGFEPDKDIPIEIIGMRPGEKLEESLWNEDEIPAKTAHKKIFRARGNSYIAWDKMVLHLHELEKFMKEVDRHNIYRKLKQLIPNYTPYQNGDSQDTLEVKDLTRYDVRQKVQIPSN